jgi:Adenine deaminase
VDASSEYVIPGLVEMHAHLDDGYGANFGRVWLAYGITSLRIPAINAYAGLEQREAFDAGQRPGRASSWPAIRSTARVCTTRAACP